MDLSGEGRRLRENGAVAGAGGLLRQTRLDRLSNVERGTDLA